jgi:hypothetical protein
MPVVIHIKEFASLNAIYGVRRYHGMTAVDLYFRMHFHFRHLPRCCRKKRNGTINDNKYSALGIAPQDERLLFIS